MLDMAPALTPALTPARLPSLSPSSRLQAWLAVAMSGAVLAIPAQAKLPEPSPEAKAKREEAVAKTTASDKTAAYKLCLAQDRVAAAYLKTRAAAGTPLRPAADLPACQDAGAYVAAMPAAKVGVADSLPLNKEPVDKGPVRK